LRLSERAEGVGVGRAVRRRTVGQLANDLDRPLEGEDAVEAMITDVEAAAALRAALALDGQHTPRKSRFGRPAITHDALPVTSQ
jgi:hypothetical protein